MKIICTYVINFFSTLGVITSYSIHYTKLYDYFVGANAFVTGILGEGRHEKRAIEYLQRAASLEVTSPDSAEPGENVEVEVKITNTGAGHKIPTGVTEEREIWLELIALDSEGKEIYHSSYNFV